MDDTMECESEQKVHNMKSNGKTSRRLRNSKSKDSPPLNGEALELSSDEESNVQTSRKRHCSDTETENHKKRRHSSQSENVNGEDGSNLEKDSSENDEDSSLEKDSKKDSEATTDKCVEISSSDESLSDSSSPNADKKDSPDLNNETLTVSDEQKGGKNDSDIVIIDDDEDDTTSKVSKGDRNSKDCEIVDKDDDILEIKVTNKKTEIEVIDIDLDDDKKSDSDSEVQVIGADEMANDECDNETDDVFPTTSSSDQDVTQTAGYPYYNSLKEKIKDFKSGNYKPVKFPHTGTLFLAENEVIIESPSLLVPLLIKEKDKFPKIEDDEKSEKAEAATPTPMPLLPNARHSLLTKRNFFQSSVGQFLINLGTSRVLEWFHRDMKRVKLKHIKSKKTTEEDLEKAAEMHEKRHNELKEINAIFNFRMRQCKVCVFQTESLIVLDGHYLTPHMTSRKEYACNYCSFLSRDPEQVVFHYEAMHSRKALLDSNAFFHECIFCSFLSPLKTKVNAHMNRCRKHFIPSQNLAPPFDFEFPGVTTKPVTMSDVIGHRRLLLSSGKNRLPISNEDTRKKLQSVLSRLSTPAAADVRNPNLMKHLMANNGQLSVVGNSTIQLPPGIVITRPGSARPQLRPISGLPLPRMPRNRIQLPNISSTASQLASSGISITPVGTNSSVRGTVSSNMKNVTLTPIGNTGGRALMTNISSPGIMGTQPRLAVNMRQVRPTTPYQRLNTPPSQVIKGSSGNTFVVCEICDSFMKDLEEVRTHMNWVHKVKIHPKMLVSRPPLNCQKCQWRFFTDQGLERHLLGAHGLVTTNMQEMANKSQDGGRCIICGAVFTYKLVAHMTQMHKVTLKPAHLSYKCTVCTATFTLYRLFESHVYNVHSGSSKRPAPSADISSTSDPPPVKAPVSVSKFSTKSARRCRDCRLVTTDMESHIKDKHMKECYVKLCRIEKCKKCLYKHDEIIVIRMSDFGLEEEDSDSSDDSSDDSSSEEEKDKEESADNKDKKEKADNKDKKEKADEVEKKD